MPSVPEIRMNGVKPAWANLPRRKCDDCGKGYKPKQPLREGQRGFCTDTCRKSYHKHGGAYRKLRTELVKLLNAELAKRLLFEEPCQVCDGKGMLKILPEHMDGPKVVKYPGDCPKCINGAILTPLGREALDFVSRRFQPKSTAAPLPNRSRRG